MDIKELSPAMKDEIQWYIRSGWNVETIAFYMGLPLSVVVMVKERT